METAAKKCGLSLSAYLRKLGLGKEVQATLPQEFYHKYATIRSVNSKKATRLYRLGEAYDRDAIYERMRDTLKNNPQEAYRLYYEFTEKKSFGVTIQSYNRLVGVGLSCDVQ